MPVRFALLYFQFLMDFCLTDFFSLSFSNDTSQISSIVVLEFEESFSFFNDVSAPVFLSFVGVFKMSIRVRFREISGSLKETDVFRKWDILVYTFYDLKLFDFIILQFGAAF